jgi:hypothetical protein
MIRADDLVEIPLVEDYLALVNQPPVAPSATPEMAT